MRVSFVSASEREASLAHAAVINALNVERVDRQADVWRVSDALAEQVRAVQVGTTWPNAAAGGGTEFSDVAQAGVAYRLLTVAPADLKLHRGGLKQLLGDVNVLVLHARHYVPAARFLPLARAVYLQQELGMSASAALYEALAQIYGITREHLQADHPKFVKRIDSIDGTKWGIDLTKNTPQERYPLQGTNPDEARSLYRDLDDVIIAACRQVAPQQKLLTEVINESSSPLIVVFAGDEDLAFAPGLSIDWLKIAQAMVAPRPGITYVSEPLVDLRLANDAERISQLEGLNPKAGLMIWSAILAQRPASRRLPGPLEKVTRPMLIAGAALLPLFLVLMALFGGFVAALAATGMMTAAVLEAALICGIWRKAPSRTISQEPQPVPVPAPAPQQKVSGEAARAQIPAAIEQRRQISVSSNGHAHA